MQPKALFLYGTNKEDGTPNFGLFTWITNCWDGDYSVMTCIGEPKLTKDRIFEQKMFSANLVSEPLLPLADYLGNTSGYTEGKMDIPLNIGRGTVLDVPVLLDSPFVMELEVTQTLSMQGESHIFICKIRNKIEKPDGFYNPIVSIGQKYYTVNSTSIGNWGQWKNLRSDTK